MEEYLNQFYEAYNNIDTSALDSDALQLLGNALNNWKLEVEEELYHRGL